jgi:hypothetical protein
VIQFLADYFIFEIPYSQTQIIMILLLVSLNLSQGLEVILI